MSAAMLEGSLRELSLADVLQLLELGRRTGTLQLFDETSGRSGDVALVEGAVTAARLGLRDAATPAQVQRVVCDLLEVRAGRFAFVPASDGDPAAAPHPAMRIEAILVEAARRADEWARISDVVSNASVVPILAADGGDAPVRLDPRGWALLAEVDGVRDVDALATALDRDPLVLAGALAELARAGLVVCLDPAKQQSPAAALASTGSVPSEPARSSSW